MSNHPHPVSVFHAFANSGSLPCHGGGGTAIIIWFGGDHRLCGRVHQRDRHLANGGADLSLLKPAFSSPPCQGSDDLKK